MWRVIDLSGEHYHLHVESMNLHIKKNGTDVMSVPFQDIHSIIIHGKENTFSEAFFSSCISFLIPVLFCNENHIPNGMLLPFCQHLDSANRLECQIKAKVPRQKQAWQKIIRAKLQAQAMTLQERGKAQESKRLQVLSTKVLSGDSSNYEAVGARVYFEALFGESFSRRNDSETVNAFLNYAYSIVRSCVARVVCSCGLHPSISVYHSNRTNPYALVDDLMEPFRPIADIYVLNIIDKLKEEERELTSKNKKKIIGLISRPVSFGNQMYEFSGAVRMYVMDYYHFLEASTSDIKIPIMDKSTWQ